MTKDEIFRDFNEQVACKRDSLNKADCPEGYAFEEYNEGWRSAFMYATDILAEIIAYDKQTLPAGLDEAAIRYAKLKEVPGEEERYYNQTGCNIYDAFKAGAEWRDKQIQKLSSELCDAAKEYSKHLTTGELNPYIREQMGFKAGAEWMAGQGVTIERIVDDFGNGASIKQPTEMELDSIGAMLGDKVIVQIRKKD